MDSEDFFKRIETQYQNQLPFVVYRKPNGKSVSGMLQINNDLVYTENFNEQGFVFSPFNDLENTVLIPSNISENIVLDNFVIEEFTMPQKAGIFKNISLESDKEFHMNLINKGVLAIKNKEFQKVVLSRREVVDLEDDHPINIYKKLLNLYKSAFVYCWYHPKIGLWLGATPETLIKIESNRFSIMALAGTQDYKGKMDVSWKNKEIQEQQFVTDFIVDNLKPWVTNVTISDIETVKAGNLLHLKTIVSAQLKPETNLSQVIESLHPTPAVCGLPKVAAKKFILKHENYKREFYTGFLGELNFETIAKPRSGKRNIENRAYAVTKNSTQLYVNLRCMQLKNKQAIIYVGGGITESSDAEREWQETVSKSLVIKNVL